MSNGFEKRYGLFTAICMVVGIVIGSGVFFKAQIILKKTGGNMPLGIAAWAIGGAIMLSCILAFANMAQKYEKVNGIVDYAEAAVGSKYAYAVGWFLTTVYYPTLTSTLAWLCARYTLIFMVNVYPDLPMIVPAAEGGCEVGPECMALMLFYLCSAYTVNALSPRLAGKTQVLTTVIKLIPIAFMAVFGVIAGICNGTLANNFASNATVAGEHRHPLFAAVSAAAFAYEGWIIATSINSELKDAKRNLPKALIIGSMIVIASYIMYYIGVAGGATNQQLTDSGATAAFTNVFGAVFGNVLNFFVAVSCIGTLNGLMLGSVRGMYSLAARNEGPNPEVFAQVDKKTNMAPNSAAIGLIICVLWGVYYFFSNLAHTFTGPFVFDSTEIPIITLYAMYIPIFIMWMKKEKELSFVKRFAVPFGAVCGSLYMILAAVLAHGFSCVWYLIVFLIIMFIGMAFLRKNNSKRV